MTAPENPWEETEDEKKARARGRPTTGAKQVSVWLPAWIIEALDERAKAEGMTKSKLVVRVLERWLSRAKPEGGQKI
jgi:hypothetical protein